MRLFPGPDPNRHLIKALIGPSLQINLTIEMVKMATRMRRRLGRELLKMAIDRHA